MTDSGGLVLLAYLVPPVATTLSAAAISYWIYRRRWNVRGARTFVGMLLVGGLGWQPMVLVQLLATEPWLVRTATVGGRLFGWSAVMSFVVFASQYTASGFHRRRLVQAMVGVVLGGLAVLSVTTPLHGDFSVAVRTEGLPVSYGVIGREPLYLCIVAVGYTLVISAYYLVLRYLQSARDGARSRIVLITLGTVIVAVLNLLSIARLLPPPGFEYAAYGALPFVFCSTVAIFRQGLLDIVPVARRTLVETLSDPVVVVADDRRVADFNRAARELWPTLSAGDRLADSCPELAERLSFPETGAPLTETMGLTVDGETRHVSVQVSPVQQPHSGELVGYSVLVRDVTELESSRRALERQNEQLDRVAATVSHDLRNPLTVASGHTAVLEERLTERDGTELLTHVRSVAAAHERMDAIIDDVLTLTRAEQTPATVEPVDLESVVRDAWGAVETDAATVEVTETTGLRTDRDRLQRVLENLFRNAVDHAAGPGGVTVRVTVLPDGEGFAVADDGPGVPPAVADRLFEYGATTSDDGTGIGLATVERLTESLGWTVEHDDSYDDGARFVFRPDRQAQPVAEGTAR